MRAAVGDSSDDAQVENDLKIEPRNFLLLGRGIAALVRMM